MFKKISIIVVVIAILSGLVYFTSKPKEIKKEYSLNINNKEISLEVADTEDARSTGLSNREGLSKDGAMVFVFDTPDTYGFWMKDMKFPIDIVWLDENSKIIHIESNVSPDSYPEVFIPPQNILYAIEFNAGFAAENRLLVGNVLNFSVK